MNLIGEDNEYYFSRHISASVAKFLLVQTLPTGLCGLEIIIIFVFLVSESNQGNQNPSPTFRLIL